MIQSLSVRTNWSTGIVSVAVLVTLLAVLCTGKFAPAQAGELVLNAYPSGSDVNARWQWHGQDVRPDGTLREILERANNLPDIPVVIRLLHDTGKSFTSYRGPFNILHRMAGRDDAVLKISGQSGPDGARLTVIEGKPLKESICDASHYMIHPDALERCLAGIPHEPNAEMAKLPGRNGDPLEHLGRPQSKMQAALSGVGTRALRAIGQQAARINCFVIEDSSHVELDNLMFSDCWLPAVYVLSSSYVALRNSRIIGSSIVFVVYPGEGGWRSAHHYELTGNYWTQAPPAKPGSNCDPSRDYDCDAGVWSGIPWGATHHGLWRVLNGSLFGAKDIAGDVLIAGNVIEHAYNGIRTKVSLAPLYCSDDGPNARFVIRDNTFRYIRDNPIEPETCASDWIVKHNRFFNVHAPISTDGVKGGSIYVFGNVGWFDWSNGNSPGARCHQEMWNRNGMAYWDFIMEDLIPTPDDQREPGDGDCLGHMRGTIVKALLPGPHDRADSLQFLKRLYVFNNSWQTRTPVITGIWASPLRFWNNALKLAGCGPKGENWCRQQADRSSECRPYPPIWSGDGEALVADCLALYPLPQGERHVIDYNGYNRPVPAALRARGFERHAIKSKSREIFSDPSPDGTGGFKLSGRSSLEGAGCRPVISELASGFEINCDEQGKRPSVGAMQPVGTLFDIKLPVHVPDHWQ